MPERLETMLCSPQGDSMHLGSDELGLYLKGQLSREQIPVVETHLADCETCVGSMVEQDKYLWCLAELSGDELDVGGDKRLYPRVATDEAAAIQVLATFSNESWDVRVVDVSKGGLGIYTERPLAVDSLIRVKMKFSVACGDVRHCQSSGGGFHAGIRLHDYFLANGVGR